MTWETWVEKNKHLIIYINVAFYRDNGLKLKFVMGEKVDILTKEANAKNNFGIKAKTVLA